MKNIVFALDIEENTAIYFVSEAVAPYRDVKIYLIDTGETILIGKGMWREVLDILYERLSKVPLNTKNSFIGKINNKCLWYIFNTDMYKNKKLEKKIFLLYDAICNYEFLTVPARYNISSWLYSLDNEYILEISPIYYMDNKTDRKRFWRYIRKFKPYRIYKITEKNISEWNDKINYYFDIINKKQYEQQYWE